MVAATPDLPLIGRSAPLAAIDELIRRASAGRGGLVVLVGDPGAGVSRLLAVARDRARLAGLVTKATRAWFTGPIPAPRRSGLVTVDDADQARQDTVTDLLELGARAEDARLAVLVGATGDVRRLDPLRGVGRLVHLPALEPAEVRQMMRAARPQAGAGELAALVQRSGGNPFLLTELLASEALLPETVRDWVSARTSRLSEPELLLLRALAVLQSAPLSAGAEVAGLELGAATTAADRLLWAGFLAPGQRLRFAQPVVRDAVYAESPSFARSANHWRAARVLDGLVGDDGDEIVAEHLLLTASTGDDCWAAAGLVRAARRSRDRGDPAATIRYLTRALCEAIAEADRAEAMLLLAEAQLTAGDAAGAEQQLVRTLALTADPGARSRALVLAARLSGMQGYPDAGLRRLAEALVGIDVQAAANWPLLSEFLTMATLHLGHQREAEVLVQPLITQARDGRLPADPGVAAHIAFRLAMAGAPATDVRRAAEAAFSTDPLVDPDAHGTLLGFVFRGLIAIDELELAETLATHALRTAESRRAVLAVAQAAYHRALIRYHRGDLTGAQHDLALSTRPRELGWDTADPWIAELSARVSLACGELASARAMLQRMSPVRGTSLAQPFARHARSLLAFAERSTAAAYADSSAAGADLVTFGLDWPGLIDWRRVATHAARALGRVDVAHRLAEENLDLARRGASAAALGSALRTAAIAAGRGRGLPLLQEAAAVLADSPARLLRAAALLDLGRALRAAGARDQALPALRDALALASECGAQQLAEQARSELLAAGARPRRTAVAGPAALTTTEVRVAELVMDGRSNPGVASELSISLKTVETHLRHVYRKLGISHRAQLAGALAPPDAAREISG